MMLFAPTHTLSVPPFPTCYWKVGGKYLSQSQPTTSPKERRRIFQQRLNLLHNSLHKLIRLLFLLLARSSQDAKKTAIDFREIRVDEEIDPRTL